MKSENFRDDVLALFTPACLLLLLRLCAELLLGVM